MNISDQVAREIVRERAVSGRYPTRRPTHPRTARLLRRLADRMDGRPDAS